MKEKILTCTWGYSMTIVEFYKVIAETPKTVTLRRLSNKEEHTGYLSGHCVPGEVFEKDNDEVFRAVMRTDKNGETYFVSSLGRSTRHYLREWDGRPRSFNHYD